MGAGPSNLYIYLGRKEGTDKYEDEYTVDITREICHPCTNFEKVSYKINYTNKKKTGIWTYYAYYSVTLYTGTRYYNLGDYGFCYYYPGEDDVLDRVDVYYTMMRPDLPIIVTFRTRKGIEYNCSYELLRQAEWDYPTNLRKYSIDGKVSDNLSKEFRKLLMSLYFFADSTYNKDVEQVPKHPDDPRQRNYIDPKTKRFHHVGFTSNCNKMHAKLYTDRWFWSKKEQNMTGLKEIINKLFDGIQVFYYASEPLLIECLTGCKDKIQHVRCGPGTNFCKAKVPYNNYYELELRLVEINQDFGNKVKSKFCINEKSTSSSHLKGTAIPVGSSSGTDSSPGKTSLTKPSEGGQKVEHQTSEKKEKEKETSEKVKVKDSKTDSTPPSSDHHPDVPSKSKVSEDLSHVQHTGHGDKHDTLPNGKSQLTPEQPTHDLTPPLKQEKDSQTVTSSEGASPEPGGDSSKAGSQETHHEHSQGDSDSTLHKGATHTSTSTTPHTHSHTSESPKTSEPTESLGGDSHINEALPQASSMQAEEEDDGSCAPIIALGSIAGTIITGTVVGAVGNFVHQCLSLIKWLT